jgi:hypothetical protein
MAPSNVTPICPSLCIDNLDIEERVHAHSIGHRSMMFHGTWGYIHLPNRSLLDLLDPRELTLEAYYESLQKVPSMKISVEMFLPTPEEEVHYKEVLMSQIAHVMGKLVLHADNPNSAIAIRSTPPPVDPIDCSVPNIQMLKLMAASDNSAKGAGQIIESILEQFGLKPEEFTSRVQIINGDLGTCKNFNALRALRTPSRYPEHQ